MSNCDLIKTIEDDQEVPNYSENSDEEDDVSKNISLCRNKRFILKTFYSIKSSFSYFSVSEFDYLHYIRLVHTKSCFVI